MSTLRLGLLAVALLVCCKRADRTSARGTDAGPAEECTGIGAPRPPGSPSPGGLTVHVAGPRPPIRDATVAAPAKDGVQVFARPMLSKITGADGARVAIRFQIDPARGRGASWPLSSTRVRVVKPDGAARSLELASRAQEIPLSTDAGRVTELVVDGRGLRVWGDLSPWSAADDALLSAPGKYQVRVEGKLEGGATAFTTGDVPLEVVPAGPAWKPVADLDAAASAAVAAKSCGPVPAKASRSAIDDVADGRWIRFWLSDRGYDADIVDVLVSPAGAVVAMQEFHHFTCVARGTPIAAPRGAIPVEALAPDDTIWGYDVATGRRVETKVISVAAAAREDLVDLGGLRLTPEHPVLAGGRWVPAADVAAGATLLGMDGPVPLPRVAHVAGPEAVFDVSVAWPHTFFAGGVLVHNKAVANEIAPKDPWRGTFLRTTDAPH